MKIQETIRRDGLRIISGNIPSQTKVLVGISALVGSAYDPENRQGLFHFFEHMAFKGTKRRSVTQIRDFANRNLLNSNATTYRTRTEYWGIAIHKKFNLLCDIIADIYAHSDFPAPQINKEKGPVLLEAARNNDDDRYLSDLVLRELLYKKNPLRQFSTGTKEGIMSITRKRLLEERERWYVPSNTVAVAVGRVSHTSFVREMSDRIPIKEKAVMQPIWDNEINLIPQVNRRVIELKDRKKSTIVLGCKIDDVASDRIEDIEDFLSSLLVSGWSSRLWNEVREKRGLAYAVNGGVRRYRGLGAYFYAFAQTKPGKERIVESLIREALFTPLTNKDKKIFEDTRETTRDKIDAGFGEDLDKWYDLIFDKIEKGETPQGIPRFFSEHRKIVNSLHLHEAEKMRKELLRPERFATVIIKPAK